MISGRVNGSFVSSAGDAGLSRNEINAVIKALQWQLDFRKLRKGDQFSVLMSREHFDGKNRKASCWACVCAPAAKITMRSAPKTANSTIAGALARRAFMRFPTMKQFRISSNFNPRRVNPVTGRVAHKGRRFRHAGRHAGAGGRRR